MKDVPERPKSRESQKSTGKSENQRHIEYMEKEKKNKLKSEHIENLSNICDDAINQIQHTDVRPMIDRDSKKGDYRPDKVNEMINMIKNDLKKIKENADKFDCFPASLRPEFLKVLQFLIKSVNSLRDQAVKDYGKGIIGKKNREEGSQALMVVTFKFEGMWNLLDGLHRIDQSQPKLEEAANSVSPHVQAFRTRLMATVTEHCNQLLVSYHYTQVPEEGSFKIACEMLQEQPGDLIEACDQEINKLTSKLQRDYKECEKRVDNLSKKGMKDSIEIDNIAGKLNDLRKLINNIEQDSEGPLYQKLKKVREGYQHCLDLQSEFSILENPKMAFAYWNEADLQKEIYQCKIDSSDLQIALGKTCMRALNNKSEDEIYKKISSYITKNDNLYRTYETELKNMIQGDELAYHRAGDCIDKIKSNNQACENCLNEKDESTKFKDETWILYSRRETDLQNACNSLERASTVGQAARALQGINTALKKYVSWVNEDENHKTYLSSRGLMTLFSDKIKEFTEKNNRLSSGNTSSKITEASRRDLIGCVKEIRRIIRQNPAYPNHNEFDDCHEKSVYHNDQVGLQNAFDDLERARHPNRAALERIDHEVRTRQTWVRNENRMAYLDNRGLGMLLTDTMSKFEKLKSELMSASEFSSTQSANEHLVGYARRIITIVSRHPEHPDHHSTKADQVRYQYKLNPTGLQNAFDDLTRDSTANRKALGTIVYMVRDQRTWIKSGDYRSRGLWKPFEEAMTNFMQLQRKLESGDINSPSTRSDRERLVKYAGEIMLIARRHPDHPDHHSTKTDQVRYQYNDNDDENKIGLQSAYRDLICNSTANRAALDTISSKVKGYLNLAVDQNRWAFFQNKGLDEPIRDAATTFRQLQQKLESGDINSPSTQSDRERLVKYAGEIITNVCQYPELLKTEAHEAPYQYNDDKTGLQRAYRDLIRTSTANRAALDILDRAVRDQQAWVQEDGSNREAYLRSRGFWQHLEKAKTDFMQLQQKLESGDINSPSTQSDRKRLVQAARIIMLSVRREPSHPDHSETEAEGAPYKYKDDETGLQSAFEDIVRTSTANRAALDTIDRAVRAQRDWVQEAGRNREAQLVGRRYREAVTKFRSLRDQLRSAPLNPPSTQSDRERLVEYARQVMNIVCSHPEHPRHNPDDWETETVAGGNPDNWETATVADD